MIRGHTALLQQTVGSHQLSEPCYLFWECGLTLFCMLFLKLAMTPDSGSGSPGLGDDFAAFVISASTD